MPVVFLPLLQVQAFVLDYGARYYMYVYVCMRVHMVRLTNTHSALGPSHLTWTVSPPLGCYRQRHPLASYYYYYYYYILRES